MSDASPVWVLDDGRPGNTTQSLGVAEALGGPHRVVPVPLTRAAALPNGLRGASFLGVAAEGRAALSPPWPDLVLAAGRRLAPVSRRVGRGGPTRRVHLMWPGEGGAHAFDLVVVPAHDRAHPGPQVVAVVGTPHRMTPERLAAAAEAWRARLGRLPRPRWVVLLGGGRPLTAPITDALLSRVAGLVDASGGSLLLSTSRRTPRPIAHRVATFMAHGHRPGWHYDWHQHGAEANPYEGFLALADRVVVSGDSMAMLSEACGLSVPVFLFAPPGLVPEAKKQRFHQQLLEHGHILPLGADPGRARTPLPNPAHTVARALHHHGLVPSA